MGDIIYEQKEDHYAWLFIKPVHSVAHELL